MDSHSAVLNVIVTYARDVGVKDDCNKSGLTLWTLRHLNPLLCSMWEKSHISFWLYLCLTSGRWYNSLSKVINWMLNLTHACIGKHVILSQWWIMTAQLCGRQTDINTTMQRCPVIDGMPHVKSHNISLHVRWTTRRDDDLWAGVLDQSQWAFKWLTAQPAVTACIWSDVAKQSSCVFHQQTPVTGVKLWGPCIYYW